MNNAKKRNSCKVHPSTATLAAQCDVEGFVKRMPHDLGAPDTNCKYPENNDPEQGNKAKTPEEIKEDKRFRELAWKYYKIYLDKRTQPLTESERNLFVICVPYMVRIIKKQTNNVQNLKDEGIDQELILAKVTKLVRLFLRHYRKKFHPLKNIILLNYLHAGKVIRISSNGRFFYAERKQEDVEEYFPDDEDIQSKYYKLFDSVKNNTELLKNIFKTKQYERYQQQGKSEQEIQALQNRKIEQLQRRTSLDIVEDATELYPGISDIFIHTRRDLTKKRQYDDDNNPYAIWIGEHFLIKIMDIPEKTKREYIFGRILLEGSRLFDTQANEAILRDEAFWQEMVTFALNGRAIEPIDKEAAQERKDWDRLEGLFKKALELTNDDTKTGMNIIRLSFFFDCFDAMRVALHASEEEDQNMSDETLIDRLWSVWLRHADKVIQEDIFEKHEIENIWRNYLVWSRGIRRFPPDGNILIPNRDGPPSEKLETWSEEYKRFQSMRQFIKDARDNTVLLNKVFNKYCLVKYQDITMPKKAKERLITQERERLISNFQKHTNIDVMAAETDEWGISHFLWTTPYTSSTGHFRGDHSKKHQSSYDGHPYGIWYSETYMRALMDLDMGKELFLLHGLEEMDHMNFPVITYMGTDNDMRTLLQSIEARNHSVCAEIWDEDIRHNIAQETDGEERRHMMAEAVAAFINRHDTDETNFMVYEAIAEAENSASDTHGYELARLQKEAGNLDVLDKQARLIVIVAILSYLHPGVLQQQHHGGAHLLPGKTWETYQDWVKYVYHPEYFDGISTLPARILDELHKLMPRIDLCDEFRKLPQDRHPYIQIYGEVMKTYFDGAPEEKSILSQVTDPDNEMTDFAIEQRLSSVIIPIKTRILGSHQRIDQDIINNEEDYIYDVLLPWLLFCARQRRSKNALLIIN